MNPLHTPSRLALLARLCLLVLAATHPLSAAPAPAPIQWAPLDEPGSGGAMVAVSVSPHDSRRVLVAGDMLGVGVSTDAGDSWQSTTGFKSWEMGDFTWHPTDPNTVWVGSMSGPYVSHDGGRTWQERREGMTPVEGGRYSAPVEKVLFDPQSPQHLLAFGGSSRRWENGSHWGIVWESRDGGGHWERVTTITESGARSAPDAPGRNIVAAAYAPGNPNRLYALVDNTGFFCSEDGGHSWFPRNTGLPGVNVQRLAVSPRDPNKVWLSLGCYKERPDDTQFSPGGIFVSANAGHTWQPLNTGLPRVAAKEAVFASSFQGFAVAPSDPRVMYTSDGAWNAGGLYGTTDGGAHWRKLAARQNVGHDAAASDRQVFGVQTAYFAGIAMGYIAVDPNQSQRTYAINSEFMLRTLDGGRTWNDATARQVGNGWEGRGYSGLCGVAFRFNPRQAGDAVLLAMDAGKLWRSTNSLASWTFHGQDPWPWGGGDDACYAGEGQNTHIYATFGQFGEFLGIGRTTNNGNTWTTLGGPDHGLPAVHDRVSPAGIYAWPDQPNQVWVVIGGALYQSTDAGDHFTAVSRGLGLDWVAGDATHPHRFFVSGKANIYRVEGDGAITAIGGPRPAGRGRLSCDSRGRLYACQCREGRSGLWRYTPGDAGKVGTWERLLDENFAISAAADPAHPDRIVLATSDDPYHDYSSATGVWVSADDGKSWSQQNSGLAMLRGQWITFNPHRSDELVFGSFGRGFFRGAWPVDYRPVGTRRYVSTAADTAAAAVDDSALHPPAFHLNIRNGGMTQGDDLPVGWDGKFGDATIARDRAVYREAPASLRVDVAAGKTGQAFQEIRGGAGATFKIAGFIRAKGGARVQAAIQAFADGYTQNQWIQLQFIAGDTEWTPFEKEVTLPPWCAFFHVLISVDGPGSGWLDEVHEAGAAVDKTVRFLDMSPQFVQSPDAVKAGLFVGDQLHLNKNGYQVWADTMQPLFDQMLSGDPGK